MGRPKGSTNKPQEVEVVNKPVEKVESVLRRTVEQKPKVRQYSTNKDHKGEGEPLCLNCSHREDMHYIEHRWTETKVGRNLQGDIAEVHIQNRKAVYDGHRPCQHACKCTQYE